MQTNEIIKSIKNQNPLILNITNHVSIDFVANGLLSIGASPIMSFAPEEAEDLIKISDAVVVNLGTLNHEFNVLCKQVCEIANRYNKPIVLDPVGAGASQYRTEICSDILNQYRIAIIRANAGEVAALAGASHKTKGVDSQITTLDAIESAKFLASQFKLTVCMSGKIDIITSSTQQMQIVRGSALMPLVTGTGCLLSAVVAAFHAVHMDTFEASAAASLFYSVCGEIAEQKSSGSGSFRINFLDALNITHNVNTYVD